MKELSMHILDLVQNSIRASASLINVEFFDNIEVGVIELIIKDNGCGMDKAKVEEAINPFYTTRTTRNVGLGIPLLEQACKRCDGTFSISSQINLGTEVKCTFKRNHIDLVPLGDIGETISSIVASLGTSCEFIYVHRVGNKKFIFSTSEVKKVLDGLDINTPSVLSFIKDYVNDNIKTLIIHNR